MPWVILDDAFPDDPRVLRAGYEALGVIAACAAYCNRALSDGFLPTEAVRRLGIRPPVLKACLAYGLLVAVPDGYELAEDVAGWQPTRERVIRERAQKAERQRRWREGKARPPVVASVDASTDASRDASRPVPPRPAPEGRGAGRGAKPDPPRCPHGRRLAADGAGCALCDQINLMEVS